jgi:hypothetical protein
MLFSAVVWLDIWNYAGGKTMFGIVFEQSSVFLKQIHLSLSFPELPSRFQYVGMWNSVGSEKQDVSVFVADRGFGRRERSGCEGH